MSGRMVIFKSGALLSYLFVVHFLVAAILVLPPSFGVIQHVAYAFDQPQISSKTLAEVTQEAREVVFFHGQLGAASKPATGQGTELLTDAEVSHLKDVGKVVVEFMVLVGLGGVFLIWIWKRQTAGGQEIFSSRFYGRVVVGVGSAAVGCAVLFPTFFELFHQVLFPQGNYSFPADSLLIQTFPPSFWFLEFVFLEAGVVLLSLWQASHAKQRKF